MVVTVVLSGLPKYVTLRDIAYNLDTVFTTDYITKFHVRNLPNHPTTGKRRVALDFPSGFEGAMDAQAVLHGHKYTLDNGREYTLSAKINHDPELQRTTDFSSPTDPRFETALVQYQEELDCVTQKNILNMHLDMVKKQIEITKNERLLLHEQKKLRKAKETDEEGTMPRKKKKSSKYIGDSDSSPEKRICKRKKVKKEKKKKKRKHRHRSSSGSPIDVSSRDSSPVILKKIKRSPSFDSRTARSTSTALVPYRKEIRRSPSNIPRQYRSPSALPERDRDDASRSHRHSLDTSKEKPGSSPSSNLSERDSRELTSHSLCCRKHRKHKVARTSSASSQSSSGSASPAPSLHSSRHSHSSYLSHRDLTSKRPRRSPSPPLQYRRPPSVSPSPSRHRRASPSPVPERYRERHQGNSRERRGSRERVRSPPRYREPFLPPPRGYRPRSPPAYRRRMSPPSRYDVREHSVFVDKTIPSTSDYGCRVREVEDDAEEEGRYVDDLLQGVAAALESDEKDTKNSPRTLNITINVQKDTPKKDETKTKEKKKKKTVPLPMKTESVGELHDREETKTKSKKKSNTVPLPIKTESDGEPDYTDLIPKPLIENIKKEKGVKEEKDAKEDSEVEDGEIYEIVDSSDDDRRSDKSNESQHKTPYTPDMPWVPANKNSKKPVERPKRVAKNPRFVLPLDKILRSMKPAIRAIGNGLWRLDWMLTPKIQQRLQDLLTGKEYMKTREIIDLYREHFPKEKDEEFVKTALQELDSGELALQVDEAIKREKEINGIDKNKSKKRSKNDISQWVPLSQPKVEPDDEVLVLEPPKPVLDLTGTAGQADEGAESDASDETVVLAAKAELKHELDDNLVTDIISTQAQLISNHITDAELNSPSILTVKEEPPEVITTENSETVIKTESVANENIEQITPTNLPENTPIKSEINEISENIAQSQKIAESQIPSDVTQAVVKTELADTEKNLAADVEVSENIAQSQTHRAADVEVPENIAQSQTVSENIAQSQTLRADDVEVSENISQSQILSATVVEVSENIAQSQTLGATVLAMSENSAQSQIPSTTVVEVSESIPESQIPSELTQSVVKTESPDTEEDLLAVEKFVHEGTLDKNVINISDNSD